MIQTSLRPAIEKRTFISPVIERAIVETAARIADPALAWLFGNCFPNTLDTTVSFTESDSHTGAPDTFIITGDIDAMWLRDSTNQVWPYLPFARACPKLRELFRGLIARQARCVLLDPYANAFYKTTDRQSEFAEDFTEMKPGVHERKYELDSLASVLRLATGYFQATGDTTPFDATFIRAVGLILETIVHEQAGTPEQIHPRYGFARRTANALDTLPNGAHGNPCKRTGMSRSPFRPSDDACVFQYPIAANAMASVQLARLGDLLAGLGETALQTHARQLAGEIRAAVMTHGCVESGAEKLFAYEVDGFGGRVLMDDANLPSLLALPYIGFCDATDATYQNTRRRILSERNPFFHQGNAGRGIGSPHVGLGWIWPLSLITQALTSTSDEEIRECVRTLVQAHARDGDGAGFIHESFWFQDARRFTRGWFAWANTFFGELILHLARTHPHLLGETFS